MKLYFSPGACSLSAHIALCEAGVPFDTEKVDLAQKKTAGGADYFRINPKGYVPALELDDGSVLTEAGTVLQYVADQKPESGLAPPAGTMERYRLMEWLNFISTEIHKSFSPLFKPDTPSETKERAKDLIARRFDYVETRLADKPYLMGEAFTVADAYLFTVVRWTRIPKIDVSKWTRLEDFMVRTGGRPKVQEALKAEGLLE